MDIRELRRETSTTSKLFSKASGLRFPLSGTFELSPVCNFACKMCYVRKTLGEVRKHERKMLTCEQWIQLAEEAKEMGMLYLLLTGGEPFLWPDFWKLYESLSQMGFVLSINTNGSMIDEAVVEKLIERPPSRINITLYGASDKTYEKLCGIQGAFQRVDRAISLLQNAGIAVKLNCSLTPYNADDIEMMIRYAEEKKLIMTVNTYMFPPVRRDENCIGMNDRFTPKEATKYNLLRYRLQYGEETYQQFLDSVRQGAIPPPGLDESCVDPIDGKVRCRAGRAAFWITWDGYMTPCGMMTRPAVDIQEYSFQEAWRRIVKETDGLKLSSVCETCKNQELCHSCAAMALAETGDVSGIPSYLCETVEELIAIAEKDAEL